MDMIWDKREDESARAYEWFCRYRDMGPGRSHDKLHQKYSEGASKKSLTLRWSSRYAWVERAEAYDAYLDAIKRETNEDRVRKTAEEHIDVADKIMELALSKLALLEGTEVKPNEVKGLIELSVKMKRDALGVAEKHEVNGEIHLDHEIGRKLSDDLLERSRRLLGLDDDA
jgi:hypothetical protein